MDQQFLTEFLTFIQLQAQQNLQTQQALMRFLENQSNQSNQNPMGETSLGAPKRKPDTEFLLNLSQILWPK